MILDKPYGVSDTVTLKTAAGEELVGRFVSEDATTITLKKVMAVIAHQQGVGLGQFAFTINPDSEVPFNKHSLILVCRTDGEMAKQYISSTTGIQL